MAVTHVLVYSMCPNLNAKRPEMYAAQSLDVATPSNRTGMKTMLITRQHQHKQQQQTFCSKANLVKGNNLTNKSDLCGYDGLLAIGPQNLQVLHPTERGL